MARIELPPGCYGLSMDDGTTYDAEPGGHVNVEDRHASAIGRSRHRETGLLSATRGYRIGTRTGRRCTGCQFLAQAWATCCPRCGGETRQESH